MDDFRATNPPSNPQLLDALANQFVQSGFDWRSLLRAISLSRVYQHASAPNETNQRDEQNYSRALLKRIDAEVLLDALCQTTGVPERFGGMPSGTRAIQLWDSQVDHDFLRLFGRPVRQSACECERVVEPSVAQVLHLLNSQRVDAKLRHESGLVARLARQAISDEQLVEQLYLAAFARFPTREEAAVGRQYLNAGGSPAGRRAKAEDLMWTMLNSIEFAFNH
jgi:hypothetical protein